MNILFCKLLLGLEKLMGYANKINFTFLPYFFPLVFANHGLTLKIRGIDQNLIKASWDPCQKYSAEFLRAMLCRFFFAALNWQIENYCST